MNFFGHAVVARWSSASRGFVLGAMLPDFVTMLRCRPPQVVHTEVASGVSFHHATDSVFHQTRTFLDLQGRARRDLRERGLARGSALAVAHVGVELLLDATLAEDEAAVRGYLEALAHAGDFADGIHWVEADGAVQFDTLRTLLASRGATSHAAAPERIAFRLERALAGRPRLELSVDGTHIVREWAEATAPDVARLAPALIEEVRVGLNLPR